MAALVSHFIIGEFDSLEDALVGRDRRTKNNTPAPIHLEPCWWCRGTGKRTYHTRDVSMRVQTCPRCDGTGKIPALVEPRLPGEQL